MRRLRPDLSGPQLPRPPDRVGVGAWRGVELHEHLDAEHDGPLDEHDGDLESLLLDGDLDDEDELAVLEDDVDDEGVPAETVSVTLDHQVRVQVPVTAPPVNVSVAAPV